MDPRGRRGLELQGSLQDRRARGQMELIVFLNAGDPSLDVTLELLRALPACQVTTVELCVPFPDSPSDGPVLRQSHSRALAAGATLPAVLALVSRASAELGLRVVLLADHRHTVQGRGMRRFLREAHAAGSQATLVHGLPASGREEYLQESAALGLGRIMSFYATSSLEVRQRAQRDAEGFIYLVSRFGRTGQAGAFEGAPLERLRLIAEEGEKPVAVGFGVKSAADVTALRGTGAAGVIVGSAATAVLSENLVTPRRLVPAFAALVSGLARACLAAPGDEPKGR
jgi:tryptophan synthase alpha chain